MGYMGLNKGSWFSDGGLDLKDEIEESKPNRTQLNKLLIKELKDKGNCCNPDGATHISLLIEDGIIDKKLLNKPLLNNLIKQMEQNVLDSSVKSKSDWNDERNRKIHYAWFKRLLKVVKNDF